MGVFVGVGVGVSVVLGVGVGVSLPVGVGVAVGATYCLPPVVTTISKSLLVSRGEVFTLISGKSAASTVFISAATFSNPAFAAIVEEVALSGELPVFILSGLYPALLSEAVTLAACPGVPVPFNTWMVTDILSTAGEAVGEGVGAIVTAPATSGDLLLDLFRPKSMTPPEMRTITTAAIIIGSLLFFVTVGGFE